MASNLWCAFCLQPPNCPSNADKFKKLFGGNSEKEQRVLNWLLLSRGIPSSIFKSDARLCIFCQRLLKSIDRLQQELTTVMFKAESTLQKVCLASFGINQSQPIDGAQSTVNLTQLHVASQPSNSFNNVPLPSSEGTVEAATDGSLVAADKDANGKLGTPSAKLVVDYPCGEEKTFELTPNRKRPMMSLGRRNYTAAANGFTQAECLSEHILDSVTLQVRHEMEYICSEGYNSILRNPSPKKIQEFNWSDICTELQAAVPTLFKLLSGFLPKADQRFLALVICMLLKKRCKFMSLVQTVMSTLLYGQSAKKQIYNYLQPFMLCMSASMLQPIIDGVVKNYNADVFLWADNLKEHFELRFDIGLMPTLPLENDDDDDVAGEDNHEDDDYSDVESCYSDTSLDSPNWEPMETDESDVITSEVRTSEPPINSEPSVAPEASGTNVIVQGLVRADTTTATVTADANRTISTTQKGQELAALNCRGFVLVGDNLDKNFRPSHQREDRQTKSLHIFHSYAVKNRVDVSSLSDKPASVVISPELFLLTRSDISKILEEFKVLISRVLVQNVKRFSNQVKKVTWHIPSKHEKEMAAKSVVVPLGVEFKNEAYIVDMSQIMKSYNKYVPVEESVTTINVNGREHTYDSSRLYQLLFFGDQLTVARARGAAVLREPEKKRLERLAGFVPTIADWHARMCLVQVIWGRFFSNKSHERGTLNQLKHLVNRTAVGANPKNNMKPTEDFLTVVMCAHVAAAAKQLETAGNTIEDCNAVAGNIVSYFVNIMPSDGTQPSPVNDSRFNYATDLLTMCLVWHGFHDAVREGDGDRIVLYWKLLLPVFQQQGRYNYAKEAFLLLAQTLYLSERKATELKWNRTVNTSGRTGCNIPCDLHMEHLNGTLKSMLRNMGSNTKDSSVDRAAKSLGVVSQICKTFEAENGIAVAKPFSSYPSFTKDLEKMTAVLIDEKVFSKQVGRRIKMYNKQPFLASLKWEKINEWVKSKILKLEIL